MKRIVNYLGFIFIIVIIGGSIYGTYYFYSKYTKADRDRQEWQNKYNELVEHPEKLAKSEAELYLEKLKAIDKDVPKDEIPEVQTVLDIFQLKDQEFFKDAQNGDKILVFQEAKKAYVYRPSENKIVNSGPLIMAGQ